LTLGLWTIGLLLDDLRETSTWFCYLANQKASTLFCCSQNWEALAWFHQSMNWQFNSITSLFNESTKFCNKNKLFIILSFFVLGD